ncbi:hypothetical protein HAV_00624 [Candidatus Hepatincola sp. Av]
MLKHFFLFVIIILIFSGAMLPKVTFSAEPVNNTATTTNSRNPNLEEIKANNKKKHDAANSYKISREKDNLACLKPLIIDGLDTLYIMNKAKEKVYAIKIVGFQGTCNWERDRLLFTKSTDVKYANTLVEQFTGNMYLTSSVRLIFSVEKLKDDSNIPIKTLQVPYFIVLHDKKTDKIIWTKNLKVVVKLGKKPKETILGKMISFNLVVPEKDVLNKELLSGMYLQIKNENLVKSKSVTKSK